MDKPLISTEASRLSVKLLYVGAILFSVISRAGTENILGVDDGEFDFDGLPGIHHEFKVHVGAMREDCFFQPVAAGAKFHVNFEVLRGGDKKVDFYVRNKNWQNVYFQQYSDKGAFSIDETEGGVYAVCVDNAFARFGTKIVFVYMVSFVMQEWVSFHHEIASLNLIAANFSTTLTNVQESIGAMLRSQASARFNVIRDWYTVNSNHYYVFFWSLMQCILIVGASLVQVYSVRSLFKTTNVTPTLKPRA